MKYWRLLLTVSLLFIVSLIYSSVSLYSESNRIGIVLEEGKRNAPIPSIIKHPKDILKVLTKTTTSTTPTTPNKTVKNELKLHKISPGNFALFALTDGRDGNMDYPCVRVLVAIRHKTAFSCRLGHNVTVEGSLYEFSENHEKQEKTFYLNCKLPNSMRLKEIDEVTVVDAITKGEATIPISYRIEKENNYRTFANKMSICVPFVFGNKYSGNALVEFVELNRIIGFEKITLYTDQANISEDLRRTIEYYEEQGILEAVQFKLPFPESGIWYYGQLLVVTDCLNRHTGISEFVAFHDLDEYMVPQKKANLLEVVREQFQKDTVGSIRVSTFYFDPSKSADPPLTLQYNRRLKSKESTYTKCIVRPHYVFEQGIHHTSRVIQHHFLTERADEQQIMLHHYRFSRQTTDNSVEDRRIGIFYESPLLKKYEETVKEIRL